MKIKLKKKENSYAQVHKNMLFDRTLSLKAKGLGAILESYSNDFDVNMKSIELSNPDGLKAIRGAIKELEDGYYLFRFQIRENGGLFTTVWAFDSEKLDVDYLKNIITGLEKIELITKNDLLQRGSQNGNPVKGSTGYPFTACRQRTPYNNIEYKNINDKNTSLLLSQTRERFDLKSLKNFREELAEICPTFKFSLCGTMGYSDEHRGFCLKAGYIFSMHSHKLLDSTESFEVWQYLFQKKSKVLDLAKEQSLQGCSHE